MKEIADHPPLRRFYIPKTEKQMNIGVLWPNYGLERFSYMLPSTDINYSAVQAIKLPSPFSKSTFWEFTPLLLGPKFDLVHTFNILPINRDFVVTCEMELPRFLGASKPWQFDLGYDFLRSERCRAILPISTAAMNYMGARFDRRGLSHLRDKMQVFRGGITQGVSEPKSHASKNNTLQLLFVGQTGLHKGLVAILDATKKLREKGVDLHLTVVGNLETQTYIVPGMQADVTKYVSMLAQEEWITHHVSTTNDKVRQLMASHDVLLFPSCDESLGWVVVEAALSGMATIASNIFALPELIEHNHTGWLIDIPLDEDRRWEFVGRATIKQWDELQSVLRTGLISILSSIVENRDLTRQYGNRARLKMESMYGVEKAAKDIAAIYRSSLQKGDD